MGDVDRNVIPLRSETANYVETAETILEVLEEVLDAELVSIEVTKGETRMELVVRPITQ